MPYDIDKIRKNLSKAVQKRQRDPNEFVPPKVKPGETQKFRFFILPPFSKGDSILAGKASYDLDNYFIKNGAHWINKLPSSCPRVVHDDECPICRVGFDLMAETQDKDVKKKISGQWMPNVSFPVNIYFPPIQPNPTELHGVVMWTQFKIGPFNTTKNCLEADDPGDPEDPRPYGVFFDENAALLFQLEVTHKSGFNNYDNSKFIVKINDKGVLDRRPIAENEKAITLILSQRHDLKSKIDPVNVAKLQSLAHQLLHGTEAETTGDNEVEHEASPVPEKAQEKVIEAPKASKATPVEEEAPKAKEKPKEAPKVKPKPVDDDEDEAINAILKKFKETDD